MTEDHEHEWVMVAWKPFKGAETHWGGNVIWACPCGKFKRTGIWTNTDD